MKKSMLVALSALLGVFLVSCSSLIPTSLNGLKVRSVELQGDNAQVVATAIISELLKSGAQFSDDGITLSGQVRWETFKTKDGTDHPKTLVVDIRESGIPPRFAALTKFEANPTVVLVNNVGVTEFASSVARGVASEFSKQIREASPTTPNPVAPTRPTQPPPTNPKL